MLENSSPMPEGVGGFYEVPPQFGTAVIVDGKPGIVKCAGAKGADVQFNDKSWAENVSYDLLMPRFQPVLEYPIEGPCVLNESEDEFEAFVRFISPPRWVKLAAVAVPFLIIGCVIAPFTSSRWLLGWAGLVGVIAGLAALYALFFGRPAE